MWISCGFFQRFFMSYRPKYRTTFFVFWWQSFLIIKIWTQAFDKKSTSSNPLWSFLISFAVFSQSTGQWNKFSKKDQFLRYVVNDTKQNTSNILDKMMPIIASLTNYCILLMTLLSSMFFSSTGTITMKTGTVSSDVFMETTASGTSSDLRANAEKDVVTYSKPKEYN